MQVLKDNIRGEILSQAGKIFRRKGFAGTTVREIASSCGVSPASLYNYFPGKDAIFAAIVKPASDDLDQLIMTSHNADDAGKRHDWIEGDYSERYRENVRNYLHFIEQNQSALELLFFHAQGSSYSNFAEDYTERNTAYMTAFMENLSDRYADLKMPPRLIVRLQSVWLFEFFKEVLRSKLDGEQLRQAVEDYMTLQCFGWRDLVN